MPKKDKNDQKDKKTPAHVNAKLSTQSNSSRQTTVQATSNMSLQVSNKNGNTNEDGNERNLRSQNNSDIFSIVQEIKEEFTNKFLDMQAEITSLRNEISCKDKQLIAVTKDLLDVKKSVQYMSDKLDESSDLSKETNKDVSTTQKDIQWIKEKTEDLEDRSRRDNLVFFNVPEVINSGENENCEKLVYDELVSKGLKDEIQDDDIYFDRVHRLGPRKRNAKHPRPIIAKLTYHKQKQALLKNGRLLKDSPMNMSEDYCRETLLIHKDLREYAKEAKNKFTDPAKSIIRYTVVYKKLLLTYTLNKNERDAKTFTRGFNIHDIKRNPTHWYIPN
jgi:hypothetical protein